MDLATMAESSDISNLSPGRIRSDLSFFKNLIIEDGESSSSSIPCVRSVLSSILERAVSRNKRLPPKKCCVFDGFEVPDMTIEEYLGRIFRYVHCSPCIFVVAYVYIDRLLRFHPQFQISVLNVHRLLITSIMVASKFIEDINYPNSYYAKVGGLSREEMNTLEIEFLFLMGFKLHVSVNVFESYCCYLEREMAFGGVFQIERSLRLVWGIKKSFASVERDSNKHGSQPALRRDCRRG